MIVSLPDVNIWIALAAEGHVHHVPAREFTSQPDGSVAFCRITQMGLLRLLTNSNVMGRAPRTIGHAYLAAFTEAHSSSLVTFDTGFERWPALKLTLLSSTQGLPRN
jgi:predicted nucleic acid-binding protein